MSGAYQLLCSTKQPEFYDCHLCISRSIFGVSSPLGKHLRKKNIDLVDAIENADSVRCMIEDMRKNTISEFEIIFNGIESKCDALSIEISLPRWTSVQKNRCNVEANSAEDQIK